MNSSSSIQYIVAIIMAAPATHLLLAEKIFDKYCPDKNEGDFYRGTEFADIRYIANIDRNLTHFQEITLEEIKNSDSFTAGLKVHSLVDLTREQFVRDSGLYELLPESRYLTQTLKAYEDALIYEQLVDVEKYLSYFSTLSDLELTFGISEETIIFWHQIIKDSIKQRPTEESTIYFLSQKLNLPDSEYEIRRVFRELQIIDEIKIVIEKYIQEFEELIKKY